MEALVVEEEKAEPGVYFILFKDEVFILFHLNMHRIGMPPNR
jgi:hypothetical protein